VVRWIEANLVHGPGDYLGRPFRLRTDQKAFLYRAYELRPDGTRRWRRVVRGVPKGDGKTELAAAVALVEFAGPVIFDGWTETGKPRARRRLSPDIPCAAASYDQAGRLYEAASAQVKEGPLADYIDVFETEMQFKDGTVGRLYRVAAVQGANDGRLPSFAVCDETHEWIANKKRVHVVLKGGVYKRDGAWMLEITTAGAKSLGSVAEDAYELKAMIDAGHSPDDETLIEWTEADESWDLEDPDQLVAAIRQSNPAVDVQFPIKNLIARYHDPATPRHEFRRYNLNQWVETTGESWLDEYPDAWNHCLGNVQFDPDLTGESAAVMAIDFAQKRDGVAVVTAQLQPDGSSPVYARIYKLDGQRIDVAGALQYLRDVADLLPIRAIGYDPRYFEFPAQNLQDDGLPMVEFPQSGARMVPACTTALEVIRDGRVVHVADRILAQHVRSAVWRESEEGPRLSKTKSKDRIDGCIALVMALQLALTPGPFAPPPPATANSAPQSPIQELFRPSGRLKI
jgi:phage terminase large subunit-like protein